MKYVVHLTSVHPRYDTRIFIKQCQSLASNGYDVTLVVADGKGDGYESNVKIVDVGILPGRLRRMTTISSRVFRKAVSLDADIYHIHDPELIPVGMKLKHRGRRVIFDSHEDLPRQIMGKPYLGMISRHVLARVFSLYEKYACQQFDGVIAATPAIFDRFLAINPNTVNVNNFPLMDELDSGGSWENKRLEVCYVGGISPIRGIREVVTALGGLESIGRLNLVGEFSEPEVEADVKSLAGWTRVNQLGFLDRGGVREVLARSMAGLVTFCPLPNHTDAQPNKMFEYMSAGVPVIASHFPLWREIIEGNNCGVCVDPMDTAALARAIDYLLSNPELAEEMGRNGRKAIVSTYNWPAEERKLLGFYTNLLSVPSR